MESRGRIFGSLAGVVGLIYSLLSLGDPFVRKPIAIHQVTGIYSIDMDLSQARLSLIGYGNLNDRIANGDFSGTQIPACCVHGLEELTYPFSGG